jgi:hypothetical protein
MKVLMFHCKRFKYKITGYSNRPKNIKPERIENKSESSKNCILSFVTIEESDENLKELSFNLSTEILKFAKETKTKNAVICPFAHLSNNLANSERAINFF